MNASIPILSVVIGAVVLLFGRKLFWLCVAAIGFAAGVTLASHLVNEPTALLQLTFAILLGFIGALLALFLQKLAIGLAGFLAGGRLAVGLVATFMAQYASDYWLTFIIGGLIGAVLVLVLFDLALTFISSLIFAHLNPRHRQHLPSRSNQLSHPRHSLPRQRQVISPRSRNRFGRLS